LLLSEIARRLGGSLRGRDVEISGAAPLETAGSGEISLCTSERNLSALRRSKAGAVLLPQDAPQLLSAAPCPAVLVDDVRLALARLLDLLHPRPAPPAGISPRASVGEGARVPASCRIEAGASIGERADLGERCYVGAGAVVGEGVVVGDDCFIAPGAIIAPGCRLGRRVRIGAGTVIGSEGFGLASEAGRPRTIRAAGTVVIEDEVEIGSNCTIARATLGETRLGRGCRLDDQVHIGHNCLLEEGVIIAAQSGIGGSVRIGRGAILGGQVGVADHLTIGAGAQIGARSAVAGNVPEGARVAGYPAVAVEEWLGERVLLRRLRRRSRKKKERKES
jgi:UDP-3-O-[3-hydroxymyristoyl] glucosamine N-acyltransferase